ncbi:MAG: DUF4235 domain-containing protein [Actinomycetes bacterium]
MSTSEESKDSAGPPQVVITLVALAAGLVAQKAVSAGWRFIRGTDPSDDDDSPLPEILVFAAVSAATVAVAKNWATHRAKALSSGRATG